jgi:hypothetical protein
MVPVRRGKKTFLSILFKHISFEKKVIDVNDI